jgi:hypothetical protein
MELARTLSFSVPHRLATLMLFYDDGGNTLMKRARRIAMCTTLSLAALAASFA